jgi:hypothetical protein
MMVEATQSLPKYPSFVTITLARQAAKQAVKKGLRDQAIIGFFAVMYGLHNFVRGTDARRAAGPPPSLPNKKTSQYRAGWLGLVKCELRDFQTSRVAHPAQCSGLSLRERQAAVRINPSGRSFLALPFACAERPRREAGQHPPGHRPLVAVFHLRIADWERRSTRLL